MDNYIAAYRDLAEMKARLGEAIFTGRIQLGPEEASLLGQIEDLMAEFSHIATLADLTETL